MCNVDGNSSKIGRHGEKQFTRRGMAGGVERGGGVEMVGGVMSNGRNHEQNVPVVPTER